MELEEIIAGYDIGWNWSAGRGGNLKKALTRGEVIQALTEWRDREVTAAKLEQFKNQHEFFSVNDWDAVIIAGWLSGAIKALEAALKPSNNDKELSPGVADTLTGWEKLNKEKE